MVDSTKEKSITITVDKIPNVSPVSFKVNDKFTFPIGEKYIWGRASKSEKQDIVFLASDKTVSRQQLSMGFKDNNWIMSDVGTINANF